MDHLLLRMFNLQNLSLFGEGGTKSQSSLSANPTLAEVISHEKPFSAEGYERLLKRRWWPPDFSNGRTMVRAAIKVQEEPQEEPQEPPEDSASGEIMTTALGSPEETVARQTAILRRSHRERTRKRQFDDVQ